MRKTTKLFLSVFLMFTLMLSVCMAFSFGSQAKADGELTETNVEWLHHRGDANRLLIKLTTSDYSTVGATTAAPGDISAEGVNLLDKTLVYLDDNTYVTLRAAAKEGTEVYYNVWGETGTVCLDTTSAYGRGKIKYITFLEGCTFPSAATHKAGYVLNSAVTLQNNKYGETATENTSWGKLETAKTDGGLAINVNNVQIRDNRLLFYFDGNKYSEATANSNASAGYAACNVADNVLIWTTDKTTNKTTSVTLGDAAGSAKFYNLYASGAFAVELKGTDNATSVKMVTIKKGCTFPDNDGKAAYTQLEDITYLNSGKLESDGGAWKWSVTDTPSEEMKVTSVTKVQVRDNKLFMFLSKNNFDKVALNADATEAMKLETLLNNVEVYTANEHTSLKNAIKENASAWFNHYGDAGCVAIELNGKTYKNATVTKVVIKKDCEFPSAITGKAAYVTDAEVSFVNNDSAETMAGEGYQSTNWIYEPEEIYLKNSAAHIRGGIRANGTYDLKLLLFFDSKTDILNASSTTPIGDKVEEYDFLDKILLYTSETEYITLREAHTSSTTYMDGDTEKTEPATGEAYYNIWGEQNCVAVQLGKYNADQIVRIVIPQGTEIPSYDYTSGNVSTFKKYVIAETIYLKDWAPTQENHSTFSTNWAADRDYGDIEVTGITFGDNTLEIGLNGTDFPTDGEKSIDNYLEGELACYDHISFDGVTLASIIERMQAENVVEIGSWINKTAYGTFAIAVEGLNLSPEKIIIRKGCQIPIYANIPEGVAIHNVFYFEVKESVMFVKQADGTYQKADNVIWKVTFDGENKVEVVDGQTVTKLPEVVKDGYKLLGWKLDGRDFTTETVITKDVDVKGEWVKAYTVTFDTKGGSAVKSQTIEEEGYADKPADPTKDNATFLGWVDKDGKAFDFNQAITADVTVYASWKEESSGKDSSSGGGCFGSVESLVGVLSLLSVAAFVVIKKKKSI